MLRRLSIWIKGFTVLALAAVVVPLLAYALLLPMLARQQIESILHQAGFGNVSFELSDTSLRGVELNDLALDDWHVEHATIEYTPGLLWNSRVRSLSIRGAEVVVDRSALISASAPATAPSTSPATAPTNVIPWEQLRLPLDRVDVTDSAFVLRSATSSGRSLRVAFEAHLRSPADRPLEVQIAMEPDREPVRLAAIIDPAKRQIDARVESAAVRARDVAAAIALLADTSPFEAEGSLAVNGTFAWADRQATWEARIEPEDLWLSRPSPRTPGGEDVANLGWHGGVLQVGGRASDSSFAATVNMDDLELESDAADLEIEGLSGAVELTSLSPAATPPGQHLDVARLRSGQMIFRNGSVDFRINDQSVIEVERAQASWLDGTLLTEGARINPENAAIEATVQAVGVQLKQLLDLFAEGHARGQGRINATLPVQVRGWRVGFGEGSVVGVGGGTLQILDAEQVARDVAAGSADNRTEQAELRQQVAEALGDFQYDVLRAQLDVEPERGLMAHVRLRGRGQTGARRGVDLEINVDGLDQLLLYYMGIQRHLSQN